MNSRRLIIHSPDHKTASLSHLLDRRGAPLLSNDPQMPAEIALRPRGLLCGESGGQTEIQGFPGSSKRLRGVWVTEGRFVETEPLETSIERAFLEGRFPALSYLPKGFL